MNYGYETAVAGAAAGGILAGFGFTIIFAILFCIFLFACMYKIYKKAGKKGWEAIIPIYNMIVLMQIVELPTWYIVLYFIPFANIYVMFKIYIELAHKFGKSTGFGILTILFPYICLPILAFGDVKYNDRINKTQSQNMNSAPSAPLAGAEINKTTAEFNENITPVNQNSDMLNNQNMNSFNVTPNNFNGEVNGLNQNINPVEPMTPVIDNVTPINTIQNEPQTLGSVNPTPSVSEPINEGNVQMVEQTPIGINNQVNMPINEVQSVSNIASLEALRLLTNQLK